MKNIKLNKNVTGIYCILNIVNGNCYIGSSKNIYYRLRGHLSKLRLKKHHCIHLQNSFNKRGEDSFYSFVLEDCLDIELLSKEQEWITILKPEYNKVLINLQRPSLSYSKETKLKISEKIKQLHKLGKLNCNMKCILVYNKDGSFYNEYKSIKSAHVETNTGLSSIRRCLNSTHKQANGFQFSYKKDNKIISKVIYKQKDMSFLNKKITITDLYQNTRVNYDSCNDAAKSLNTTWSNLRYYYKRKVAYKKRYLFADATKQEELLENPTLERQKEGNQQPSLISNDFEGSTTNSQVQTSNVEDSNGNTSILPGINQSIFKLKINKNWFNNSEDIV